MDGFSLEQSRVLLSQRSIGVAQDLDEVLGGERVEFDQASASLTREVQSINGKLQQQAKAVQTLGDEVKSLKSDMSNVNALKRDVNALVVLQKDRVLEQLQKPQAAAPVQVAKPKDLPLQYPRPKPAE